jgi:hypothetical protein
MPSNFFVSRGASVLAPALCLAISACTVVPTAHVGATAQASVKPSGGAPSVTTGQDAQVKLTPGPAEAAPTAAPTLPAVVPNLGLVLDGLVTIDAAALLDNKFAEVNGSSVRLLGEHGAGLISDKGYGLVANNGGTLVANNGSTAVATSGGSITSKVKYALPFGLLDAGSSTTANVGAHALVPVQGMVVTALSLRDGSVLAGPIATDAQGRYHLGFVQAPQSNLQIVASINHLDDAKFHYETLIGPTAAPVLTSDTTRAVADYLVRVLAARLQRTIDDRIAGKEVVASTTGVAIDDGSQALVARFNTAIAKVDPRVVALIDLDGTSQPGTFSKDFAHRVLSFANLNGAAFNDFYQATEELRQFAAGLPKPADPPLADQIVALASYGPDAKKIPDLLVSYGMSSVLANAFYDRLSKAGIQISLETAQVAKDNYLTALGPVFAGLQAPASGGSVIN